MGAYSTLFLPDSDSCFLYYIHIFLYCFLTLRFYVHFLYLTRSPTRHILQFIIFDLSSLQSTCNITYFIVHNKRKSDNAQILQWKTVWIFPSSLWTYIKTTILVWTIIIIILWWKSLKGKASFLFLCNPPKLGASRVCSTFSQITKKILAKAIFHWLELITEIPSFLQIFLVREPNDTFF